MSEGVTTASSGVDGVAWEHLIPGDEVREFAATVRARLTSHHPTTALLRLTEGAEPTLEGWDDLVALGILSIGLPEELDGLGTLADLAIVTEEVGRSLVPLPVTTTAAAVHTLIRAGLEPDPTAPTALAVDGGARPLRIFDGLFAGTVVLVSSDGDGTMIRHLAVADRTTPSSQIDATRPTVTIEPGDVVAEVRVGATFDEVLGPARVVVAADLVGVADLALDMTVAHALDRHQFGRPIGSFQGVKHQLADAHVALERARSLVRGAASALVTGPDAHETVRLTLLAKAAASEVAVSATALRTQLLGAMGLTFESDNHLSLRRARATAPFLGKAADLYARVAALYLEDRE